MKVRLLFVGLFIQLVALLLYAFVSGTGQILAVVGAGTEASLEEVEFGEGETIISGTLAIPEADTQLPGVILVPGDGPIVRDDPTLTELSDYLISIGFAVLRTDKRGVGRSSGSLSDATTADLSDDVTAAYAFLQHDSRIVNNRIGIVGHSEGALIAVMVASRIPETAFIVLMAHPTAGIEENLHLQRDKQLNSYGASDNLLKSERLFWGRIFALVRQDAPDTEIEKAAAALISGRSTKLRKEYEEFRLNSIHNLRESLPELRSPWLEWLLGYDPSKPLVEIHCPILAIFCEKDWQVPPEENRQAMEEALRRRKRDNYDVKLLPGLNHRFQKAETGSPDEYESLKGAVSPDVLKAIENWLLEI